MSTAGVCTPSTTVLRRPHFLARGQELYFLVSTRPFVRLSEKQCTAWNDVANSPTIAALRGHLGDDAPSTVDDLVALGICELAEEARPNRAKVLVIEPHSDDALLSVGGTMWLRRHDCEFTIATLGSRSNFSSYYFLPEYAFFNTDKITALRSEEGQIASRMLCGKHLTLGLAEVVSRYCDGDWSLDWFAKHRESVRVAMGRYYTPRDLEVWTDAVVSLLKQSAAGEIWMPAGVGGHCDHQLARDACLRAMVQTPELFRRRKIAFYPETPYIARFPAALASVRQAFASADLAFAEEIISIDSVFDEKLRLLSIYGSQFKLEVVRPEIDACATLATRGHGRGEALWHLAKLPTEFDAFSYHPRRTEVRALGPGVADWCRRHHGTRILRIVLRTPSGRWAADVEALSKVFPGARFEVYAAPLSAAEVERCPSPNVTVIRAGAGAIGWLLLMLRLIARPAPTLLVAGDHHLRETRILARLARGTLVIARPDDFFLALEHTQAGGSNGARQVGESRLQAACQL